MGMDTKWHPATTAGVLGIKKREIVAVYGGGGKTTLLNNLAREIAEAGGKVILTTTTKIFPPEGIPVVINPDFSEAKEQLEKILSYHPVVCLGSALLPQGKLDGIAPEFLEQLFKQKVASYILVEADGAARRPIKGYASHEPVIPPGSGIIIPVIGSDALGAKMDEKTVHRPEFFSLQSGTEPGTLVDINSVARCLGFMIKRGLKAAPGARVVPVVNKADLFAGNKELRAAGMILQDEVKGIEYLFLTAARETAAVKMVLPADSSKGSLQFPPGPAVSCVVLAAGKGKRMGMDKLFLTLGEKTILEHTVDNALRSDVEEVVLVTRPRSKKAVAELFEGKNVRVVTNPRHLDGMASSLKAGLSVVNPLTQGVIFALGDQPFVTPAVYNALISSYHQHWNLLTAPLYQGQRGNPVLMDRRIWPQIMKLEGDRGGRDLFSEIPEEEVSLLELDKPEILYDIDTQEDYQRFLYAAKKNS